MKTKFLSPLLGVALTCILFGCSKPDNTNNTHSTQYFTDTSTNYLSCVINGLTWHSTQDSLKAVWSNGRKDFYIRAGNYSLSNDMENIVFQLFGTDTLPNFTVYGVGGYPVTAYYHCVFKNNNDSLCYNTNILYGGSLSMTIDASGKRINGQFNFKAIDTVNNNVQIINSGKFSMPYIEQ
jgi:hypothetical protein